MEKKRILKKLFDLYNDDQEAVKKLWYKLLPYRAIIRVVQPGVCTISGRRADFESMSTSSIKISKDGLECLKSFLITLVDSEVSYAVDVRNNILGMNKRKRINEVYRKKNFRTFDDGLLMGDYIDSLRKK